MNERKLDKFIHHRDDLAGEHGFSDAGQGIIFIIFMAVWITDIIFHYSNFPAGHIPLPVKLTLGIVCILTAGYLSYTGMRLVFGEVRKSPRVIRESVFGVVRHPIYLGEVMLYLGLLFFSTSLSAVGVWIVAIGFLYYISKYEEKLLVKMFGEEYQRYMKEVGMFFPRLSKRKNL
jgi:protein-S-isoprenylcysteine O-methyltransferase Ste14